jgi:hypothetical protein
VKIEPLVLIKLTKEEEEKMTDKEKKDHARDEIMKKERHEKKVAFIEAQSVKRIKELYNRRLAVFLLS